MERTLYQEGLEEEQFMKERGFVSEAKLDQASAVSVQFGCWFRLMVVPVQGCGRWRRVSKERGEVRQ